MLKYTLGFALVMAALGSTGCSGSPGAGSDDQTSDALVARANWKPLMDDCVQAAVGAAARQAFDENNLQHLKTITVDGDLAVEGSLKVVVTTGNDEDGDTDRAVDVEQTINTSTGRVSCDVKNIDGHAPGDLGSATSALNAVVDPCTGAAIVAANKLSDNYWHLYGLSLDDGDPASSDVLQYTVTGGNDEDGNTDYRITVRQGGDRSGKRTCKVTSAKASR